MSFEASYNGWIVSFLANLFLLYKCLPTWSEIDSAAILFSSGPCVRDSTVKGSGVLVYVQQSYNFYDFSLRYEVYKFYENCDFSQFS